MWPRLSKAISIPSVRTATADRVAIGVVMMISPSNRGLAVDLGGLGGRDGRGGGVLCRGHGKQGSGHEQGEGSQGGSGKDLSRHDKNLLLRYRCPSYAPFHVAVQIKLLS